MKRLKLFFGFISIMAVLWLVSCIFQYKFEDGIYQMKYFYEQKKDTVDVLVLGSSHAYCDINTGILYHDYGVAAYDLCGSMQPIWNSYYDLVEALKTQQPKLIILEGFRLTQQNDYDEDAIVIKNTYGMKWSLNKYNAICASVAKENVRNYLCEWIQWHIRYKELGNNDFEMRKNNDFYYNTWKGFLPIFYTKEFSYVNIENAEKIPLTDKVENYYRKILELAQENNIPILIVVSPYSSYSTTDAGMYETAKEIAEEYDVVFIDYNKKYADLKMDYSVDCADEGHLNWKGTQKYTNALGQYITEHYYVPDRRNDIAYNSWEQNANNINRKEQNNVLTQIMDTTSYVNQLINVGEDYTIILNLSGSNYRNTQWERLFIKLGIDKQQYDLGGTWIITGKEVIYKSSQSENYICFSLDHNDELVVEQNTNNTQNIMINQMNYIRTYEGGTVVVWDNRLSCLVDHVAILPESERSITR